MKGITSFFFLAKEVYKQFSRSKFFARSITRLPKKNDQNTHRFYESKHARDIEKVRKKTYILIARLFIHRPAIKITLAMRRNIYGGTACVLFIAFIALHKSRSVVNGLIIRAAHITRQWSFVLFCITVFVLKNLMGMVIFGMFINGDVYLCCCCGGFMFFVLKFVQNDNKVWENH